MSKVDELKAKFPKVNNGTFLRMVQFDFTGTHKYLEYMLKNWAYERIQRGMSYTINQLMEQVKNLMSYYHITQIKTFTHKISVIIVN